MKTENFMCTYWQLLYTYYLLYFKFYDYFWWILLRKWFFSHKNFVITFRCTNSLVTISTSKLDECAFDCAMALYANLNLFELFVEVLINLCDTNARERNRNFALPHTKWPIRPILYRDHGNCALAPPPSRFDDNVCGITHTSTLMPE